jgi:hypothetical protein
MLSHPSAYGDESEMRGSSPGDACVVWRIRYNTPRHDTMRCDAMRGEAMRPPMAVVLSPYRPYRAG